MRFTGVRSLNLDWNRARGRVYGPRLETPGPRSSRARARRTGPPPGGTAAAACLARPRAKPGRCGLVQSPHAAEATADRIALDTGTRDWIARWRVAPGAAYRAELRRLNHLLARAKCYPEMVITKDGFQVTERWRIDSANELIAGVAAQRSNLLFTSFLQRGSLFFNCHVSANAAAASRRRDTRRGGESHYRRARESDPASDRLWCFDARTSCARSVFGRPFEVIHDQGVALDLGRFELQPELVQCRGDVGASPRRRVWTDCQRDHLIRRLEAITAR